MSYSLLKSLHLMGVVLFLGNIIVTALWKTLADRSRSAAVIVYGQRLVTVTDIAFTAIGATLIAVTGHLMAGGITVIRATPWLTWGSALFTVSGLLWVLVLIPIQIGQSRIARSLQPGAAVPERYWRLSKAWMIVGSIATVLPVANLYLMVFKPS